MTKPTATLFLDLNLRSGLDLYFWFSLCLRIDNGGPERLVKQSE